MTTNQTNLERNSIISDINQLRNTLANNAINSNRKTRTRSSSADQILDQYIKQFIRLFISASKYAVTVEDTKFKLDRISLKSLRDSCGRYYTGTKEQYWSKWFEENIKLYTVIDLGIKVKNKQQITRIALTNRAHNLFFGKQIDYQDVTMSLVKLDLALTTNLEFFNETFSDLKLNNINEEITPTNTLEVTPINIDSLNAYIAKLEAERDLIKLENPARAKEILRSLESDLMDAIDIKRLALGYVDFYRTKSIDVSPKLIQVGKQSEFGRVYLTGINLQSCPKIVRHAALGHCNQYDIAASVFAWRYDEVNRICALTNNKFTPTLTKQYLNDKNGFRTHIAKICFPNAFESNNQADIESSIKAAKQILTSVSFGADTRNSVWFVQSKKTGLFEKNTTAIKELINNDANFDRLINDQQFDEFLNEQSQITNIVVKHYTKLGAFDNLNDELTKRLKTKSVKMSYLYQQFESQLINTIKQRVQLADSELQVLLTVHDAVYTNKPIADISEYIRENIAPSFKFDHTIIDQTVEEPTVTKEDTMTNEEYLNLEIIKHQEHMAEEQRLLNENLPELTFEKPVIVKVSAEQKQAQANRILELMKKSKVAPVEEEETIWQFDKTFEPVDESERRKYILQTKFNISTTK